MPKNWPGEWKGKLTPAKPFWVPLISGAARCCEKKKGWIGAGLKEFSPMGSHSRGKVRTFGRAKDWGFNVCKSTLRETLRRTQRPKASKAETRRGPGGGESRAPNVGLGLPEEQ